MRWGVAADPQKWFVPVCEQAPANDWRRLDLLPPRAWKAATKLTVQLQPLPPAQTTSVAHIGKKGT
jgi:hypothetical protein